MLETGYMPSLAGGITSSNLLSCDW